jgi:hypothetical protein
LYFQEKYAHNAQSTLRDNASRIYKDMDKTNTY